MDGVTLGDSRTRLKENSLVFTGPFDGRPYDRSDFRAAFNEDPIPVSAAVLAFGPLMRNHEWYVTLTSHVVKRPCLPEGQLL